MYVYLWGWVHLSHGIFNISSLSTFGLGTSMAEKDNTTLLLWKMEDPMIPRTLRLWGCKVGTDDCNTSSAVWLYDGHLA